MQRFKALNGQQNMRYFLALLLLPLFTCNKDKIDAGSKVEIYLLESYELVAGKCQVNASTITLKNEPLVANDEIITYSNDDHTYTVTRATVQKIVALPGRTPFALTINKEIIFTGFYMPLIMSSTCEHSITMSTGVQNKIFMNLGYPYFSTTGIDDKRNDPSLLAILHAQGKLR